MIAVYHRGLGRKSCEVRLDPEGRGYELVVIDDGRVFLERFERIADLLAREHELIAAWRAMGWRETGMPSVRPERLVRPRSGQSE